jgi:phage shock protein PspC (stress-responsive transcriptional regulator)
MVGAGSPGFKGGDVGGKESAMALSDELEKLAALRERGVLSDEEFARAKARLLDGAAPSPSRPAAGADAPPGLAALNALRRSAADRWIGGVCGGIARATGVDAWIWRLLFALLALFGGTGVVLYVLLWIFVPTE